MEKCDRYARQIMLAEIGEEGQQRLAAAKVLVVGAGGLGSSASIYLASAGVGHIGIMDYDNVSPSNLNRQILYEEDDCNRDKVTVAVERLRKLNSDIEIVGYNYSLSEENAEAIVSGYDMVVDATDNFKTRFLLGDVTGRLQIPLIYGAISGYDGMVTIFNYGESPFHYRDLWQDETELLSMETEKGVIGTTAGITGILQANEVIKIICGVGDLLSGKLLICNMLEMHFEVVGLNCDKFE